MLKLHFSLGKCEHPGQSLTGDLSYENWPIVLPLWGRRKRVLGPRSTEAECKQRPTSRSKNPTEAPSPRPAPFTHPWRGGLAALSGHLVFSRTEPWALFASQTKKHPLNYTRYLPRNNSELLHNWSLLSQNKPLPSGFSVSPKLALVSHPFSPSLSAIGRLGSQCQGSMVGLTAPARGDP